MIHIMNRIFNYTDCTTLTLTLYVLHNLQGKLSQCKIFVLSFNVGKEEEMQSTFKFLIGEP